MLNHDDRVVRAVEVEETAPVQPDVRYARNGDVAIAYQMVGEGDRDLVHVPEYVSNLVYDWESPYWRNFYERLARSFRVILFDKRGTGISDRGGAGFASLETRMEDMRSVLDAVGSESAVVFGAHEGGQMAALYAATYPERVDALVLFQFQHGDAPFDDFRREWLRGWGTQEFADQLLADICPTLLRTEQDRLWFANRLRVGASPEIGLALNLMYGESDIRAIMPTIHVPTLVLYRGSWLEQASRETAAVVPNARSQRIDGTDGWGTFLSPEIVDQVERFVDTVSLGSSSDSMLATVLFTDLVDSSSLAAELGDGRWAELVERHHAAVRRQLRLFRGVEVDTAGDGFFATFDGPARAIRCAGAIRNALDEIGVAVRIGIHTGECAIVQGKPSGIAVSTGARVAAAAAPREVLVSQTVKDLVAGSGLELEDRGEHELKGVPGTWRLFAAAA